MSCSHHKSNPPCGIGDEVDRALQRILGGTYGVCEQSGKRISAARLRAVPWTRFARDVAEALEKKGVIAGPHRRYVERPDSARRLFSEEEEPEPADNSLRHR